MSRFALAGLRLVASLAAGAAAWTTFWLIRGGEPGPAAYVASLAASLLVYVVSATPVPRPWVTPEVEGEPAEAEPVTPPTPAESPLAPTTPAPTAPAPVAAVVTEPSPTGGTAT